MAEQKFEADQSLLSGSKGKKNKKKKGPKSRSNGEGLRVNGDKVDDEGDGPDAGDGEESYSPSEPPSTPAKLDLGDDPNASNGIKSEDHEVSNGDERTIDVEKPEDHNGSALKSLQLPHRTVNETLYTKGASNR